ncbi:Putative G-patch domain, R3H domain, R3H domain superfamily protein [Colletotrichum destructivum]|uniref:Protein SQS1 n=1 Tax=Colletotrichum destructivum TaxID=34406 RepID=A0AAX4IP85_9PEZI|nr:Putative G-patch domain, R3H domain, R3H domain superfamily protein [Colletotrichum destructivum]
MPRGGKRGGGGARAPPRNAPRSRGNDRSAPDSVPGIGSAGFTLQDEARSTAHRSSPWSSDSRLRHRPITFVNTGSSEPLKQLEDILQKEDAAVQSGGTSDVAPILSESHDTFLDKLDKLASASDEICIPDETLVDVAGDLAILPGQDWCLNANFKSINEEDNTNSVEAEVPTPLPFFLDTTGDKRLLEKVPTQTAERSPSPVPSDSSEEIILFRGRNKAPRDKRRQKQRKQKQKLKQRPFNLGGIRTEIQAVENTVRSKENDNVRGSEEDKLNSTRQLHQGVRASRNQEDDLIADYIANMREHGDVDGLIPAQAYSRRDIGGSLSESESIEESFQTITGLDQANMVSSDVSEPDNTVAEVDTTTQPSDAEITQKTRKHTDMCSSTQVDDGLLSPQSEPSDQDIGDGLFASAADRFANEVDDFDFMDWNRPALKRKKGKGAKGKVPVFDISDSELEGKMQAAWKNDRLKKAERKKERQALRAQGLLGKHANPEDLRTKYPHGMGLDQIADELRTFLLGTQPSLTLPPMDNHARKVIHELASKFNIKSKSTGSGDQRRPMLHRTFRTAKFADETFDMAITRVGRKYFPRNDIAVRAAVQRQSARRGGGGHAGVLYRDGEVVGGSAPELGQENKGRAMLEKMGWSSGTALGALNNKGILQPVAHVVKRSKAGLG